MKFFTFTKEGLPLDSQDVNDERIAHIEFFLIKLFGWENLELQFNTFIVNYLEEHFTQLLTRNILRNMTEEEILDILEEFFTDIRAYVRIEHNQDIF